MFVDIAQAATGVPQVDTIIRNVSTLVTIVVGVMAGAVISHKGVQHFSDEGGGHMTGGKLAQMVPGAVMGGAGFGIAGWAMGIGQGADFSLLMQASFWGTIASEVLNPLAPPALALLIYRLRKR